MKIIQVNSHFHGGGVDTQTLELCAGLLEAGHEVMLAVNPDGRWVPRARALPGLRIEFIEGGKLHWGLRLRRLAEQFGAQVLHAHHGRDYWTTGLACKLAGNKPQAVLTRHLMTKLSSTSARWLLWLGHAVAVSQAVRANLERELRGDQRRLHLVYSGVDIRHFKPDAALRAGGRAALGWDESHLVYALVGGAGLPDGKGQREFVEAGARLIAQRPEVRLLIVGEGDLIPVLERRIAELGLQQAIRCVGFTEDVERIVAMNDVLVHPAVGTEALGLVIWEGMAAENAVIASRLGGIPETFVDPQHGRLVTPRSVDELYAAMRLYADDPAQRRRCGAAARQFLIDHDYTRSGQAWRFAALYQEIQPRHA